MSDENTFCYIGRRPCGCVVAAAVDLPECQCDNAKIIAKWMREGLTVERMGVVEVRTVLIHCPHKPAKKRRKTQQPSLIR